MKLTPDQLRRIIAQETRKALQEAPVPPSYEPTNIDLEKITPRHVTGDGSAEAAVHAFFHDLYNKHFDAFLQVKNEAYADWGATVDAEVNPTQRSPGTNERLLRTYVKVLLEVTGDPSDFSTTFPTLSTLINNYTSNKGLWTRPYTSEYRGSINRALESIAHRSKEDLLKFIDDAGQQLDTLINLTSEFVESGPARDEFENFKVDVWDPARKKLERDMPSGQGNPVALRKRNTPQDFNVPPPTVPPEKKGDTWKNVTRTAQRVGKDLIKNIRGLGPNPPPTKPSALFNAPIPTPNPKFLPCYA